MQQLDLAGDIARELDHLDELAVGVGDRVVRRLDPDFLAVLADALVLRALELAVAIRPIWVVWVATADSNVSGSRRLR